MSAPYVSSFLAEAGRSARARPRVKTRSPSRASRWDSTRDATHPNEAAFESSSRRSRRRVRSQVPRGSPPSWLRSRPSALTSPPTDRAAEMPRRDEDVVFVNPVLGPELVAGSSRLKGGSATKIILDAAFAVAEVMRGAGIGTASLENTRNTRPADDRTAAALTSRALSAFEAATRRAHSRLVSRDACGAASACASAAGAVAAGGDVSLVSVAEFAEIAESVRVDESPSGTSDGVTTELRTVAGVTVAALVDASEQRPTFGTPAEKYRAFGGGGWNALFGKSGSATNDRDGVEATFRDGDFPRGRFDVSWDAYVRDAETKKHLSVGDDARVSVSDTAKRKETTETKTMTNTKTKTFLLVLFTPADGARAARRARAARLAMALERAKHPDGEGVRRASFAFLCVRADAREPKTPPWEANVTNGGAESGLASAFGADAVFVDLVSPDALGDETRSRDGKRKRFDVSRSSARRDFSPRGAPRAPRAARRGARREGGAERDIGRRARALRQNPRRADDRRAREQREAVPPGRARRRGGGGNGRRGGEGRPRACGVEPKIKQTLKDTRRWNRWNLNVTTNSPPRTHRRHRARVDALVRRPDRRASRARRVRRSRRRRRETPSALRRERPRRAALRLSKGGGGGFRGLKVQSDARYRRRARASAGVKELPSRGITLY